MRRFWTVTVSRWFAVNRCLLFLSRVTHAMFSELMRSYLGCRSSLTMVGIQFVLPLICGRWGYTLRIYALYIRLKHKSLQRLVNFWKLLQNCIKCAIIKHTKGTIALSQSDGFASSWWGAVSFLQELYSLCVVFFIYSIIQHFYSFVNSIDVMYSIQNWQKCGWVFVQFLFCEADNYTRTKRMYGEIKEIVIIL